MFHIGTEVPRIANEELHEVEAVSSDKIMNQAFLMTDMEFMQTCHSS
jgi:hypothetical protein